MVTLTIKLAFLLGFLQIVIGVPYVTVQQGELFGETVNFNEDGVTTEVDVYKGIPYAEPPLRFKAPEEKQAWSGQWNATYFGNSCMQDNTGFDRPWFRPVINEDCLYLNVYVPNPKPIDAPVMVFIHGGSYMAGTGMDDDYSGVPMAAFEGIVTVVINYRLNVFGFFSTGDEASPGNYGLLDQAEALKWVRLNIEAFGGNGSSVTIFGESAGAGSVDFHRFSRYSRDLFDQAILQSGTSVALWSYQSDTVSEKSNAVALGKLLNCNEEDSTLLVECLSNVNSEELYQAYLQNDRIWFPNRDGTFIDESPRDMMVRGDFKQGPIMVGFNKDEGTYDVSYYYPHYLNSTTPPYIERASFEILTRQIMRYHGGFVNKLMEDSVYQEYLDWSKVDNSSADYFLSYLPIFADIIYSCPALDIIRSHSKTGASVFMYFMTHVPLTSYFEYDGQGPGWLLCGHGEDLPFVFGWGFNPTIKNHRTMTFDELQLSRKFMRFWANFAKTGDPSRSSYLDAPGSGDMEWPQFTIPELQYKELSLDMSVGSGIKADKCAFWNGFYEDLRQTFISMKESELKWKEELSSC